MSSAPSATFFQATRFVVIGATADRAKYGNKVLRWYLDRQLDAVPVNPKGGEIEGKKAHTSLSAALKAAPLSGDARVSLSLITPPAATLATLEEAVSSFPGTVTHAWCQPGAADESVARFAKEHKDQLDVVYGGPCVLVQGDDLLRKARL